MRNSFGQNFRLTTFGESHGPALGVVIDGCPAGVVYDEALLLRELARRRPGRHGDLANLVVTERQESDQPEILSGIFEGKTLGTPIAVLVRNQDARPLDYTQVAGSHRQGHADDVWKNKFGISDPRGGGRSSGRETVSRVMGGAFAKMFLKQELPDLQLRSFATQIGPYHLTEAEHQIASQLDSEMYTARFPSVRHEELGVALTNLRKTGDSWGGVVEVHLSGVRSGLGQPVFHKLKSDLAAAMLSVGAVSAFELGEGLHASLAGTAFHKKNSVYGGIRGGISTGETIVFKVHVKPTSSILDVAKNGRHDPCIVPRAIPVFEAMAALVLADHALWSRLDR